MPRDYSKWTAAKRPRYESPTETYLRNNADGKALELVYRACSFYQATIASNTICNVASWKIQDIMFSWS